MRVCMGDFVDGIAMTEKNTKKYFVYIRHHPFLARTE